MVKKKGKKAKVKKTVYKKCAMIKHCTYTIKKPYHKTYIFGITAYNKKNKGKRKSISVKVPAYQKTRDDQTNKQSENTHQNTTEENAEESSDKNDGNENKNHQTSHNNPANTSQSSSKTQVPLSMPATLALRVDDSTVLNVQGKNISYSLSDYGHVALSTSDTGVTLTGLSSGTTTLTARNGTMTKECVITVSEQYDYQLKPMLAPFATYFILETNDPDPYDLEFVDNETAYPDSKKDPAIIKPTKTQFIDVNYTNLEKKQINHNCYICSSYNSSVSDGGKLMMKRYVGQTGTYMETDVNTSLPVLESKVQYLVDHYTNEKQSFFEKLSAVQNALDDLAVYPRAVLNTSQPTGSYPSLACSPYKELSLNKHYENIYRTYSADQKYLLSQDLYPFVLDSLGFPNLLWSVAKTLDPSCSVEYGSLHYMIKVTKNGETRTYGGAGAGTADPVLDTHIKNKFSFDGTSDDYYAQTTLDALKKLLYSYANYAADDMAGYEDLLDGTTFKKTIGKGSWIRVAMEGTNQSTYAYELKSYDSTYALSDVWIDGRYISENESFVKGAKFADHNTASIVLTNKTLTDQNGTKHKSVNALYRYNQTNNCWIDEEDYSFYYSGSYDQSESLPDEYVLTQEEVKNMAIDKNTNTEPDHGYIYDGTAQPGTPF